MAPTRKELFENSVQEFKTRIADLTAAKKNRLILVIMANTKDPSLAVGCQKDAASIKKAFQEICEHTGYHFCCIEISGDNYSDENLMKALWSVGYFNDVTVTYFSGHGFSYQKDKKYKYPQLDMRRPGNHPNFKKIEFIEKNTTNLKTLLHVMMLRGGRINIAIGDCCNTTIPFTRKKESIKDLNVTEDVMIAVSKKFTKHLYTDENNMVSVLVSSSTQGQESIADNEIGSIFTHHFTKTISEMLAKGVKYKQYFPWVKVLKSTTEKAFRESKGYKIENGKPGKQQAIFEVFVESDSDFDKRMKLNGWRDN